LIKHLTEAFGNSLVRAISIAGNDYVSTIEARSDPELNPNSAWWQSFLRGAEFKIANPGEPGLRVVDAFCGSGGLSLGVRLAAAALGRSVEYLAAVDTDVLALAVYEANLSPQFSIPASVPTLIDFHVFGQGEEVEFGYAPELLDPRLSKLQPVDLFVAGAPCEGHSNLNNHTRREDPRNHLYLTAVALGVALDARAILIENVPESLKDRRRVVQQSAVLLRSAGYEVETETFKGEELGVPQRRARFFLLAVKQPVSMVGILRQMRHALRAPATPISWAVGDLLDHEGDTLMDTSPSVAATNLDRIDYLFDNDLYDLPNDQRPFCHQNGTTYQAVYGRMHWDRPAHTITTGFGSPGQGRYVHSLRRRLITPHEAARIQTFPDWFSFAPDEIRVSRKHLAKCIGDAVPPMLAYAAALGAIAAIGDPPTAKIGSNAGSGSADRQPQI
jgi:DNA (cytosine-5)-methyltransferase 1